MSASTTQEGIVRLNDTLASDSSTQAATASVAKTLYNLVNNAISYAGTKWTAKYATADTAGIVKISDRLDLTDGSVAASSTAISEVMATIRRVERSVTNPTKLNGKSASVENTGDTLVLRDNNGGIKANSGVFNSLIYNNVLNNKDSIFQHSNIKILFTNNENNEVLGVTPESFLSWVGINAKYDKSIRNAGSVIGISTYDGIVSLRFSDNYDITMKGNGVLTLNDVLVGQSGILVVRNANKITGFAANLKFRKIPTDLQSVEIFSYFKYAADAIAMGRA